TSMGVSWMILGKADVSMTLNGVLAGLVAITAPCAYVSPSSAAIIGVMGGLAIVPAVLFFDKVGVDDPVGAISVHGVCGVVGTLCVGLFAQKSFAPPNTTGDGLFFGGGVTLLTNQLIGAAAVFAWCVVSGGILFGALRIFHGLRVSAEEEIHGLDLGEHGSEAYPDFAPALHSRPEYSGLSDYLSHESATSSTTFRSSAVGTTQGRG
ncbi:MAG: ammonium transporter, partial [Isosphaeraceae bacterium]